MVEGKHQHRNGQPQCFKKTANSWHLLQRGAIPLRDEVERQTKDDGNQRINQPVGNGKNDALVEQHDANHHRQQHERNDGAWGRGHVQLVFNKRNDGIGDTDTVNQQDGIDGKKIEQRDEAAAGNAKVFLHNISDVLTGIF